MPLNDLPGVFSQYDDPRPPRDYEREQPRYVPYGEGRIARSWTLLGQSWRFLKAEPRLFVLPLLAMVATAVAAVAIFAPTLYLTRDASAKLSFFIAGAVSSLPFIFISTFFNVGFLSMVMAHQRGERATEPWWRRSR